MSDGDDDESFTCDACGTAVEGEPTGHGLLLFPRGDTVLREQPPLCERCALAIGVTALRLWEQEEDGG